ncbi:transglycosylase SLT domain-containing protein [Streptomyces sp. NPDC059224]|uniref:transglycosylase SLT domain-containing protein n=1 Tax=Streptomyces sp. NPDC059224 TaxID=3346775 RepID=UPI0036C5AE02
MPKHAHSPTLTKHHKIALAGVATLGAAALAFSAVPSSAETAVTGSPQAAAQVAYTTDQVKDVKGTVTDRLALQNVKVEAIAAKKKAPTAHDLHVAHVKKAHAAHVSHLKKVHAAHTAHVKQVRAAHAAKVKAAHTAHVKHVEAAANKAAHAAHVKHLAKQAASRSAQRPQLQQASYGNNLDGWIRQSLDIMHSKGIPGSYNGLYRNIMRESSGNPNAINNWDINAINGIPSKGLLQVIPPTFATYHVAGTSWNIYDPVANITAACNYAAHRYGSMDNVNSAY